MFGVGVDAATLLVDVCGRLVTVEHLHQVLVGRLQARLLAAIPLDGSQVLLL